MEVNKIDPINIISDGFLNQLALFKLAINVVCLLCQDCLTHQRRRDQIIFHESIFGSSIKQYFDIFSLITS